LENKKELKKWLCFFGVLIVFAGIFAFSDLNISKEIYNKNSLWAQFFEAFGEHPSLIIGLISACIIFRARDTKKLSKNILISILTLVLSVFSGLMLWILTADRAFHIKISGKVMMEGMIFSIILVVILQFILYKIPKEKILQYKRASIIAIICVFASVILVNVIKTFWGRVRFRDMIDGYEKFTNWYLPQGNTGNQSFPSGHASNGWALLLLTLFVNKKNENLYKFTWIFALAWGIAVVISRIVMGAHFASDVLFGSAVMIGLFMLFNSIMKEKDEVNEIQDFNIKQNI
jgi:membrane-associated phospholipid phosphatase